MLVECHPAPPTSLQHICFAQVHSSKALQSSTGSIWLRVVDVELSLKRAAMVMSGVLFLWFAMQLLKNLIGKAIATFLDEFNRRERWRSWHFNRLTQIFRLHCVGSRGWNNVPLLVRMHTAIWALRLEIGANQRSSMAKTANFKKCCHRLQQVCNGCEHVVETVVSAN